MVQGLSHDKPGGSGADAPVAGEQFARQEAIQQIERRRRFWFRATAGTVGMIVLAAIWAIAEYNNAADRRTNGFSRSSGIPNVVLARVPAAQREDHDDPVIHRAEDRAGGPGALRGE
jgi:hypothetical protein